MNPAITSSTYRQLVFQISGFDRLNFVGDITNAIPQHEHCRITELSFDCDGIRADGRLIVQVQDEQQQYTIDRNLRAIRGIVSIRQTN